MTAWLGTAAAAEITHGIMTAWLRSRMPGYPDLPTPQLAPGVPLTVPDLSTRFSHRRRGNIRWAPSSRLGPGYWPGAGLADLLVDPAQGAAGIAGPVPVAGDLVTAVALWPGWPRHAVPASGPGRPARLARTTCTVHPSCTTGIMCAEGPLWANHSKGPGPAP